ncbi:MAG: hypothetical protein J6V52_02510 [Bacteroidaceae bacterium]|nr:hypothetical protein [Bacteroidaceae bacterium]
MQKLPRFMMQEKRFQHTDLAAGILILWIIIFHAINGCKVFGTTDARVALPYLTFSMPWFFYKSGQFYKADGSVRKDVRKLLLPFLLWSGIGYSIYLAVLFFSGSLSLETAVTDVAHTFYIYGYIPVNVPAWFVLSLFFVRVIGRWIVRHSVPPLVCIAAGTAFGYVFHLLDNPHLPFWAANIVMGVVFYLTGYKFSAYENNPWLRIVCFGGYAAFLLFGCSIVGHHRNVLLTGHYLMWPLFAYCGIVTFNTLCRWLDTALSSCALKGVRPVTFVGRHTMTILITHAFVYFPIQRLSPLSPWQNVGLIILGYVLLLVPLLLLKRKKAAGFLP